MDNNFRYPGEFEKVSDVFMTWLPNYVSSPEYDSRETCIAIIKVLVGKAKLHINCASDESFDECQNMLKKAKIDTSQITFTRFNDTNFYVRDNGPSVMNDGHEHYRVINPGWSYYGVWDPNSASCKIARQAGVHMAVSLNIFDIVNSPLISEGGDREFNGAGVMMCIEGTEVDKRNPKYTKKEVEEEYKRIYNVKKIIWLPKPIVEDDDYRNGPLEVKKDGTPVFGASFASHIDEMCRFIDKDKILLAEVTEEEATKSEAAKETKNRLDAAYKILKNSTDTNGNYFKIYRMPVAAPVEYVLKPNDLDYDLFKSFLKENNYKFFDGTPWPNGPVHFYAAAGYCNFLICNSVVVGQRYYHTGMSDIVKEKDELAKRTLEECFPGRKVTMVDALPLNLSGGGVHCWTKEVVSAEK
ncbi:agmatine/peptidylarginine deiminase [Limosilactobacillus vaginalis]|uniref:agmatine deiminase family protein n=1 Tax=Limosilactobacillus vaginalis TaxID=1633 RepID=UPI0022A92F24|nr:agmatine deiminase family protein [Limosilactobacillus vaginalis]MCZ2466522.1 agmatine deiminase family protein [Limosilactobacillus vaginalis]